MLYVKHLGYIGPRMDQFGIKRGSPELITLASFANITAFGARRGCVQPRAIIYMLLPCPVHCYLSIGLTPLEIT